MQTLAKEVEMCAALLVTMQVVTRKLSEGKLRARDRSQAGREVSGILPHDESRASESGAPSMG